MNPIESVISSAKNSLSSQRLVFVVVALTVTILIASAVIVALVRDHVSTGIEGLLGIGVGFFVSSGIAKLIQNDQEKTQPPTINDDNGK